MRRSVGIFAAALCLAPLLAAGAAPVVVEVTYLGQGQFSFRKHVYDYAQVLQAIRTTHQDEHIDLVSVDVPVPLSVSERQKICGLKQDLGTQLKMHLEVGDGTSVPQFCN